MMMKSNLLMLFMLNMILMGCQSSRDNQHRKEIDLNELTISQIHKSFLDGDYNAADLIIKYIERIQQNDSVVNSISFLNPNALRDAQDLDAEYQKTGILRPLHGIPMIVKDNFNTIGMPTTAGSLALKDFIPNSNATMVQQLIDAGAIIIAKSNMAEWAFSPMHTESSTHGTTMNPYNTDYVPAGSSGGTAAAIAANFAVIGLGTDTGNSIRGPSSHNALVGFRSTMGLTSRYGVIPIYLRNDIAGPMCRTVEDATIVLNIIAGKDEKDTITLVHDYERPDDYLELLKKDVKGMRIGVFRQLTEDINPEISVLFEQAISDLLDLDISVIDSVVVEGFSQLRRNQWCDVFKQDIEEYLRVFVRSDSIKTLEDIARIGSKSKYAEESVAYFMGAPYGRTSTPDIPCDELYKDGRSIAYRRAIETCMEKNNLDAMIYPSWNHRPALIDSFEVQYRGDNSQIVAPHTGLPAFTVPMGFTSGNLPAGLQFLGGMFGEVKLVPLLQAYENATRHRKPPNI